MGRPVKSGRRGKYLCQCIELYPESQQKAIDYIQKNWSCAWALHDKDVYDSHSYDKYKSNNGGKEPPFHVGEPKKTHVHFVVRFQNKRALSGVANELSIVNGGGVSESLLEPCDSERGSFEYLWHKNDLNKYQYDKSIVHVHDYDAPSDDVSGYMSEKAQAAKIREMPVDLVSLDSQIKWCLENDCYESFSSKYTMWRDWRAERAASIAAKTRGNVVEHLTSDLYGCGHVNVNGVSMVKVNGVVPFEEK